MHRNIVAYKLLLKENYDICRVNWISQLRESVARRSAGGNQTRDSFSRRAESFNQYLKNQLSVSLPRR